MYCWWFSAAAAAGVGVLAVAAKGIQFWTEAMEILAAKGIQFWTEAMERLFRRTLHKEY